MSPKPAKCRRGAVAHLVLAVHLGDHDMENQERRSAYASLWVLALAFGWIEASVVVYLREIYVREVSLHGPNALAGLQITLVSLPSHLVGVEIAREACTILLLGAVAWLAGRRLADRAGAFLLSFGIWDVTYTRCSNSLWAGRTA